MRSIQSRVTLVVAVGALLAIWLPAMIVITVVLPNALEDSVFVRGLLVATFLLAVVAWSIGRLAAHFAVLPLTRATDRLAAVAAGHLDDAGAQASLREIERLEATVGEIVRRSWERERRQATAIGALAHDVRASLAAMAAVLDGRRANVGGAEFGMPGDVEVATALAAEVRRMQSITGDLVVLMRSTSRSVREESIDVAQVAESVARAVRCGSDVDIEIVATQSFVRVAPAGLIERILRNLIENAAAAARTWVRVEVLGGLVVLSDDGPGFPSSMLGDGHGREGATRTLATAVDHGAGFEIASRLAESCGGHVVIERSTSAGSTVLVYL